MSVSGNSSQSSQSGPQPFTEFSDHYLRSDDIIRPKPRRLVDMRRPTSGISGGMSCDQTQTPRSATRESPLGSSSNKIGTGFSSPPILPAKPLSSYLMKPLPPRPSSISNSQNGINHPQAQQPMYSNPTVAINSGVMNNNGGGQPRPVHSVAPSNFNVTTPSPTSTPHFNGNVSQRSVPNLPQLFQIQQKRAFLSPPAGAMSYGGSSSNLSNGNNNGHNNVGRSQQHHVNNGPTSPYYSDLIPMSVPNQTAAKSLSVPPAKIPEAQPRSRVRVEWKSVENLQRDYNPRISTDIDIGEPIIAPDGTRISSSSSPSAKNLNLSSSFLESPGGPGSVTPTRNELNLQIGDYAKILKDDSSPGSGTLDLDSPAYDQIRSPLSPADRLKESPSKEKDKDKVEKGKIISSSSSGRNLKLARDSHVHGGGGQVFSPATRLGKSPLGLFPTSPNPVNLSSNGNTINGSESTTDGSSLGRSSTSDGDFGGLLGSPSLITNDLPVINSNIPNLGGTPPSAGSRKPRHPAPLSKLKSRRRNILQHLSMEEMRTLNGGNNGISNNNNQRYTNTGTGGSSSSDGSSGHASMSDSQTSGSPPAPAEYARIAGPSPLGLSYKSVLKSVPEDDSNLNLSGSRLLAADKGDMSNRGLSGGAQNPLLSGGGKKSSSKSSRHRNNKESIYLENGNSGLEDIKQAIEQLTLRSAHQNGTSSTTGSAATGHGLLATSESSKSGGGHHGGRADHHSSYSTSTYSSMSGSECDRHRRSHLIRHSSLETINTQVTSADEFVWVDSHNRLVELQHFPWSHHDILKVIERNSRLKDNLERISMETVPRISYLLQRALVRISREAQRLSRPFGFCSKHEISSALRIVLAPALADSCVKACQRAAAMFSVSTTDPLHRESKSLRAGLHLQAGHFHRWMCEVRLGRYVHEFAAIHLAAGMENLIEEILGQALSFITTNVTPENNHTNNNGRPVLTAALLEQAIANNGDFWGLLQPFAHLNSGRTASGALALPRWASIASVDSSGSSSTTLGGNQDDTSLRHHQHKNLEQSLLTTCVGSIGELSDILSRVLQYHHKQLPLSTGSTNKSVAPSWSPSAIHTLFYFMRCSQLETAEQADLAASTATLGCETIERQPHQSNRVPVQELVYERPFIVLPPLIEWVRVATAHADHRHSWLIDKDDVMQASRLLLPGIDCPVRLVGSDEFSWPRRPLDEFECNRRLKIDLAFNMLTSGRSDLVAQALLLMPLSKANTFNESGLSPLILATIRGEDVMVTVLLSSGADPDVETPANGANFPQANSETQHWTALTFASLMGHVNIVKILLEHGANVEGGVKQSEEKSTQTPLQVASATGHLEIVSTLLSYGGNPFLSTLARDSLCYMGSAQRGSFSAISVAGAHGQRTIIHKLLSHPVNSGKEVLSLEEILAEGVPHSQPGRNGLRTPEEPKILSKSQMKILQEGMYQSAENGHLEITLDLRNLGVPWTLHCWVNALATAQDLRCEPVVDQLLQDFLQILPHEDFSQGHFVEECLPLLFTIFRNSKNEGTTLLLADIFQTCYGRDPIKEIRDSTLSNGTRIDPKYVNNPELSDVQFRVEGKVFYAHKIVLVTSSPRFKSMLKSAPESNPPILQINDIRYHIFQMVMEYLYNGGCDSIKNAESDDILELMAAANFFQLDGLLRFSEAKCSNMVNIESVVSLYIHAKVYNAAQLLDYCQGFLLQNMVASLTYDDSVRRLVFGKKLHNHDVLAGLLVTLQARLKSTNSSLKNSSNKKSK